jgi:hypothetical protein
VLEAATKLIVRASIEEMMNNRHIDRIEVFVSPGAIHSDGMQQGSLR